MEAGLQGVGHCSSTLVVLAAQMWLASQGEVPLEVAERRTGQLLYLLLLHYLSSMVAVLDAELMSLVGWREPSQGRMDYS